MPLHIRDVTLVVYAGSYIAATQAALDDTLELLQFDDMLIFANEGLKKYPTKVVPFTSIEDATRITWRELHRHIKTTHVLGMQWDGYPMKPEFWSDEFRLYDFIGSVWPWHTTHAVGNTGFCLQSAKLLHAMQNLEPLQPEDSALCRTYRPFLENYGISFAPVEVADTFAVEHGPGDPQAFGFHGVWNMVYIMDDETLKQRLSLMSSQQWLKDGIQLLALRALIAGRRDLYRWVLTRVATKARDINAPIFP